MPLSRSADPSLRNRTPTPRSHYPSAPLSEFRDPPEVPPKTMNLYFAYGSNMWDVQMAKRCPHHQKRGVARLVGYRWIISARGYANVIESPKDEVEGVLFEISASDEKRLDSFEGVDASSYRKAELQVILGAKRKVALVYLDPVTAEGVPKQEYVHRINSGLANAGLSEEYVSRYVRKFIPPTKPG